MKRAFFLIPVLFFSCSRAKKENLHTGQTLKNQVESIEQKKQWNDEIEPEILSAELPEIKMIDESVKKTPLVVAAAETGFSPEIFPSRSGGFSLDFSGVEKESVLVLKKFLENSAEKKFDENSVDEENFSSFVIFLYDFENFSRGKKIDSAEIGRPYEMNGILEFPVRFFFGGTKKNYISAEFFLKKSGGNWKIIQAECRGEENG